jgi:hypothetical protein
MTRHNKYAHSKSINRPIGAKFKTGKQRLGYISLFKTEKQRFQHCLISALISNLENDASECGKAISSKKTKTQM